MGLRGPFSSLVLFSGFSTQLVSAYITKAFQTKGGSPNPHSTKMMGWAIKTVVGGCGVHLGAESLGTEPGRCVPLAISTGDSIDSQ